jgi:hypothetical protein
LEVISKKDNPLVLIFLDLSATPEPIDGDMHLYMNPRTPQTPTLEVFSLLASFSLSLPPKLLMNRPRILFSFPSLLILYHDI